MAADADVDAQVIALQCSMLPAFASLCSDIKASLSEWIEWRRLDEIHRAPLPGVYEDSEHMNSFRKLLLIKAFRPEKLIFMINQHVAGALGQEYVESPALDLGEAYGDSTACIPLIFILSVGADPYPMLMECAKQAGMEESTSMLSLGQGQGPVARRLIQKATKEGEWVFLQNCHLAASWMNDLERICESLTESEGKKERGSGFANFGQSEASDDSLTLPPHENFRLWLSSMPTKVFPVSVLQSSVKMTLEPPRGLRANLKRSYADIKPEFYESAERPRPWKKLLFGLAFFNAVIQERRKFGPIGWNVMYEFSDSDFATSVKTLRMLLDEQEDVPWPALQYLTAEVNYGGRVTDDWDRRLINNILHTYFQEAIVDDDGFRFSTSGKYFAPDDGPLEVAQAYINELPADEEPEVFGMHQNASLAYQAKETNRIVQTVIDVQPRTGTKGGGKTPEETVDQMAADFLEQLPAVLTNEGAHETTFVKGPDGALHSLSVVLIQEMERFNKLLTIVRDSLKDTKRAIAGMVVMSEALEGVFSSLFLNRVPGMWAAVGFLSMKPLGAWFKDLITRVDFLRTWITSGPPTSFWMSGLFFPQGFLTGVLQTFARKHQVAIDTLSFRFEVKNSTDPALVGDAPEEGVLVHGLFVDGAVWNYEEGVIDVSPPMKLYTSLPVVHFLPEADRTRNETDYACPLYKTAERYGVLSTTGQSTNFVLPVDLPSNREPSFWVLQGVALLTSLPH